MGASGTLGAVCSIERLRLTPLWLAFDRAPEEASAKPGGVSRVSPEPAPSAVGL